jgi:hypothetical protein
MSYSNLLNELKGKLLKDLNDKDLGFKFDPEEMLEKMKHATVFAEAFKERFDVGTLSKFLYARTENKQDAINQIANSENSEYGKAFQHTIDLYKQQLTYGQEWLAYMCVLERFLIQLDCYVNPKIVYRIQKQKSGNTEYQYILLRAPFHHILYGKNEVRGYYMKFEDFEGQYETLEELVKHNKEYVEGAYRIIREMMKGKMYDTMNILNQLENSTSKLSSPILSK